MMLFELPDPACVLSYKAPPHLGLPDETQLGQLIWNFRYTMTLFFLFVQVCPVQYLRHTWAKTLSVVYLKFRFNWATCMFIC